MALRPGARIGPYVVLSSAGAGGMGEVYRARDEKLARDVALKVLPRAFADDPERLLRFEREARTLASLNHQNIAAIYGLEQSESGPVLVMEFVDGRSLDELIVGARPARPVTGSATAGEPAVGATGASAPAAGSSGRRSSGSRLAMDDALAIARQIADALEAAHDAGIVHRDLKPANVKVRPDGTVKVLDFGLAKALEADGPGASSPGASFATMTSPAMTAQGVILGTASYMSPEQARGRQVDRRADIWAFGVVLFEMLAGEQLFGGDSIADVLAAVMTREPDLALLPAATPPRVRALIVRCLDRDPKQRLQAMGEARIVLSDPAGDRGGADAEAQAPPGGAVGRWSATTAMLAVGLAVALAGAAWVGSLFGSGGEAGSGPVRKLDVAVEHLQADDQNPPLISPDGTKLLYRADDTLWVRDLTTFDQVQLPNSAGGLYPAWSPDSRAVVYARLDERIWRSPIDGQPPTVLGPTPEGLGGSGGLVVTADGRTLVSGAPDVGLTAIPANGGVPETLVALDKSREADFHEVSLLPDGQSVVYVTHVEDRVDTVEVFDGRDRKVVFRLSGEELRFPSYADGYLVFERRRLNSGVWAVKFSLERLEAEGAPFLVASEASLPSAATDGTLSFVRRTEMQRALAWVDRTGVVEPIVTLPGRVDSHALSPDGRRAAIVMGTTNFDLWTVELGTGALSRITSDAGVFAPVWSPDGGRLFFGAFMGTPFINVYSVRSDGVGGVTRLTNVNELQMALDVTHDGRRLLLTSASGRPQLATMPTDATSEPTVLFGTPFAESAASLSPDDRWVAYESNESGQAEISVRPIEPGAARVPVSTGGGQWPRWSPDGRTIFFRQGRAIMAAPVTIRPDAVDVGRPEIVFETTPEEGLSQPFSVSPDGQRFLFMRQRGNERITLVLNWPVEAARNEERR